MGYFKGLSHGLDYHFEVLPSPFAQDVAFVHGNLASRRWWYPLLESWKAQHPQTGGGRIFLLEFLGCGLSQAPKDPSQVNMHTFAKDFVALLKEQKFQGSLVGHSTGGLIAGLMMAQAPGFFKSGFALDPVGAKGVQFDQAMTQAFEAMKADRQLTATVIASTILNVNVEDPFFQQVIVEDAYRAVQDVGDLVLRALAGLDTQSQIAQIQEPWMVAHGDQDVLLPKADSAQLASLAPRGQFQEVTGAGHCLNYENPAQLGQLLQAWWQSCQLS